MYRESSSSRDWGSAWDEEVQELGVLVPRYQAEALETFAHRQGVTMGQLVRQLIRGYVDEAVPT
jgi:hypothetical protein